MKYIFITGGVVSSLGKGLTSASIAMLLENQGLKVAMLKLDPYLNVDPGTMSPFQHGEVYVTDDGAETDLDLGHYFRYTNSPLSKESNATTGQIYDTVIRRERRGDYLGKTVQVIPHVTDEIKRRIERCANHEKGIDVTCIEIGGTIGDIESQPFLEAIRQFRAEHPKDCLNIHLTYVPHLKAANEVKTKPTQHSVQALRAIGIFPDFILCRCENILSEENRSKISLFCSVPKSAVIDVHDVKQSIYEVPEVLLNQNLNEMVCEHLNLPVKKPNLTKWNQMLDNLRHTKGSVTIGVVGKYVTHQDAYKSVYEALYHAATAEKRELILRTFDSEKMDGDIDQLKECDGILIPGGFGERGWVGKVDTAKFCREKKIPYFGICLGMQVMVVEFARNVLKLTEANSTEMHPATEYPVISLLEEQQIVTDLGGTMRLGAFLCNLTSGSRAAKAYGKKEITERHRHRYEFNNIYKSQFEENGMHISGINPNQNLCEIVENKDHPWMLGVQFHPEYKSKPIEPHPLFLEFIKAAIKKHG